MPFTPTPRRTSNHRRSAPPTPRSNNAQPLGDSVQDRIRQWQAQGAASAPAPDAVSVRSNPMSDVENVEPDESRSAKPAARGRPPTTPIESTAKRKQSKWIDADSREWVREIRSNSTPRKRVISDDHWKARTNPKETRSAQGTLKDDVYEDSQLDDQRRNGSPSRAEREERRRRTRESRRSRPRQVKQETEDDSVRVFATPPISRRTSAENAGLEEAETYSNTDDDLARKYSRTPQRLSSIQREDSFEALRPEDDDGRHRRRSKYAEILDHPTESTRGSYTDPTQSKSRKGSIFSKTKEMFAKNDPAPAMSNRLPSIEAWLDEQPDPFVDTESAPVEVPAPLKMRHKKRRSSTEPTIVEDSNKIWQAVQASNPSPPEKSSSGRRRRRSRRSAEPELVELHNQITSTAHPDTIPQTPTDVALDSSPTGLRRRGARVMKARNRSSVVQDESINLTARESSPLPAPPLEPVDLYSWHQQLELRSTKPCPPTGAHRLTTIASVETFDNQKDLARLPTDTGEIDARDDRHGVKRKSNPYDKSAPLPALPDATRDTASPPSADRQNDTVSVQPVLDELAADEAKYIRELRTLVDGVVPVLLQCVLSKSDSVTAAGLFTSSASAGKDINFTKPIVDMGVALERLKSLHTRIPTQHVDNLLSWAQGAQRAYADYLKAWRLGFQDVIVNLAPLDETKSETDGGMARDKDGDVINTEGKKVDVAYMLKRPLVRLKHLSKTFNKIKEWKTTEQSSKVADTYDGLAGNARARYSEERGRLEDEAAANIDATKARNPRTMAAVPAVTVEKSRKVKARDQFNMTLVHSSGQRIDCRIEMILRESQPGSNDIGDVLVCEVEDDGKWLLFPPIERPSISARKDEKVGDLVVMIRGKGPYNRDWHELLALSAVEPEAASEWLQMLGSNPLPPKLSRSPSLISHKGEVLTTISVTAGDHTTVPTSPAPEVHEASVPIGEPSVVGMIDNDRPSTAPSDYTTSTASSTNKSFSKLNLGGGLQSKIGQQWSNQGKEIQRKPVGASSAVSTGRSTASGQSAKSPHGHSTSQLAEGQASSPIAGPISPHGVASSVSKPERPGYHRALSSTPSKDLPTIAKVRSPEQRTPPSSTPLTESIRDQWSALSGQSSKHATPTKKANTSKSAERRSSHTLPYTEDVPTPPAHGSRHDAAPTTSPVDRDTPPPPPHRDMRALQPRMENTPHLTPQQKGSPKTAEKNKRRSSSPLKHEYAPSTSSPSDRESDGYDYGDSSSETSEDVGSEAGDVVHSLVEYKGGNWRKQSRNPIPPLQEVAEYPAQPELKPAPSATTGTLAPSDSASQGPYRAVPPSSSQTNKPIFKTIGLLCSWSNEKGKYEHLVSEDCSIVVSAGLLEIFEITAAHSTSATSETECSTTSRQPLAAYALTPNVQLHRGSGLDINIRSPPLERSQLKTSNQPMFRLHEATETEKLYLALNWARMNNPTYRALQRARPAVQPEVTFNLGDTNTRSKSGSWFSFSGTRRQSSFRASSAPDIRPNPGSTTDTGTETSTHSALSVFKRLSASSKFNLNRSSVIRKQGRAGSVSQYSSSQGGQGSGTSTPAPPSQLGVLPGPNGPKVPATSAAAANGGGMINNLKVRLYVRGKSNWKELGAARLTILPPSPPPATRPGSSDGTATPGTRPPSISFPPTTESRGPRLPSSTHTPHRVHGHAHEKRILLTKDKSSSDSSPPVILVDAVLGESSFERIGQAAVVFAVWKEDDNIKDKGGVTLGRDTKYMINFAGVGEADWVFGLVGGWGRYTAGGD